MASQRPDPEGTNPARSRAAAHAPLSGPSEDWTAGPFTPAPLKATRTPPRGPAPGLTDSDLGQPDSTSP
jgi:hypothetical protein